MKIKLKMAGLTLEDETNMLSRNIGHKLPLCVA